MFNHYNCISYVAKVLQNLYQQAGIPRMQANAGFIKDI